MSNDPQRDADLAALTQALKIGQYTRHILLCTHGDCAPDAAAQESWGFLKKRLRQLGLADAAGGVYRSQANCLDTQFNNFMLFFFEGCMKDDGTGSIKSNCGTNDMLLGRFVGLAKGTLTGPNPGTMTRILRLVE